MQIPGKTDEIRPKFSDPDWTANGEPRATVRFTGLKTLWVNTGTLCNIACANCYIESSPSNDRLVYLAPADLQPFLEEVHHLAPGPIEIGFTGGEPFLNPFMMDLLDMVLAQGHRVLILTNAMRPMMRPKVQDALLACRARHGDRLILRVSLDHWSARLHDTERGPGAFEETCIGVDWLARHGFSLALAGRTCWGEPEAQAREGHAALIAARGWPVDVQDPLQLVLFPEMDAQAEVPEITTACWSLLGVDPASLMCASARMILKRKGATRAEVVACTLLPYAPTFSLGASLGGALEPVKLQHRHCAKFCVLGGGSCSA